VPAAFQEPDWNAPINAARALAEIPSDAVIAGMFLQPIVSEAKRRGMQLPSARERYLPFSFYPQREHAALLLEACSALYPERPVRAALRSLGRAAPKALAATTVGKVVVGCEEGVHEIIAAFSRTYDINVRPAHAEVIDTRPNRSVVRLERVYFFVDCHHVGVYEGVLRYAQVRGTVLCAPAGPHTAELLIEWRPRS
jgi:uncharacterized protein (TIGR02265 family)